MLCDEYFPGFFIYMENRNKIPCKKKLLSESVPYRLLIKWGGEFGGTGGGGSDAIAFEEGVN